MSPKQMLEHEREKLREHEQKVQRESTEMHKRKHRHHN
jgi:hypothetical protein